MNEQFVNELATALRKVGTIHTVGEEWVSYIGEIPVGGVPYTGQMVTRATYSALWSYAQSKGLVKTEAEWQQIATANGGNVPYYSSGDGSTTFRMPKIVGYVKGASSQSVAGDYVAEGLPNIEGNLTTENASDANFISDASMGQIGESGAFYISQWTNKYVTSKGGTSLYSPVALDFNASYSNPIYGASNHVTPETSVVMFGVYAFGAIVESGELDAPTLATGLATLESNVDARLREFEFMEITANTDLNNYKVIGGRYVCRLSATAASLTNSPTNVAFRMDVSAVGSSGGVCQIVTAYNGLGIWVRNFDSNGWSTWVFVGGKNVVRSVNGKNADASGNVAISVPEVYVTETWKSSDGTSWYRKYSDGWIEQGGSDLGSANPTTRTITFPVPFTKVNSVTVSGIGYTDSRSYETGIVNGSVTLTGFGYHGSSASNDYNNSCSWVAYGYYK